MHLGVDSCHTSKERELLFVKWIDAIFPNMHKLFIVGDLFDYWFEYKRVIPKGYSHLFAKLRQIVDQGIDVHLFVGNHDIWMFDYFTSEYGITVHKKYIDVVLQGKKILIGHGDGLGPQDKGYKIIKKIFSNRVCQYLWSVIHPNLALGLMKKISKTSRSVAKNNEVLPSNEWLVQYAEYKQSQLKRDYYVFGHRHKPIEYNLSDKHGYYINLGDWLHHFTYAEMYLGILTLKKYNIR